LFFGTPHTLNRQPSRWLNAAFIPAAWNPKKSSSYNLQLLPRLDEFREQVEDYQFISFYGDADEVRSPDIILCHRLHPLNFLLGCPI
jgi:hypothetical protein